MSWSDSMIKQAKKIIKMYPQKRSAIGPLLHLAQSKDGYISDDSIAAISELVGITEVQVKSVSTFYSMYCLSFLMFVLYCSYFYFHIQDAY